MGWNKKIFIWPDLGEDDDDLATEPKELPPQDQAKRSHQQDIMSVCYSSTFNMLFTGALDGSLIAWSYENGRIKFALHDKDETCVSEDFV